MRRARGARRRCVREARGDARVERVPRSLANDRARRSPRRPAGAGTRRPVRRARSASRAGSPPPPRGQPALAVPAFGQADEELLHSRGEPEPRGEHLRDLADRGEVRIPLPARLRQPSGELERPHGRGSSGLRQGATGAHRAARASTRTSRARARCVSRRTSRRHSASVVQPDVHQQACEVRLRGRGTVDSQPVGQPHRDERAVEPVLEREAHGEVGARQSAAIASAARMGVEASSATTRQ